jgi:hypothetical protein
MPSQLPKVDPTADKLAKTIRVGPFASVLRRATAVTVGTRHAATQTDALTAWGKSWSKPAAYGIKEALSFTNIINNDGVVWFGPPPVGWRTGGFLGFLGRGKKVAVIVGGVVVATGVLIIASRGRR